MRLDTQEIIHSFISNEQMKCLAAVLVELKKPLVLEEIEIPKLSYGQVLLKVLCSGICGSQLGEISGVKGYEDAKPISRRISEE